MAARSILQHTGIPPSWLEKRPKIPSRNWLIFLSVTSSVVGLYLYDRQQCKHIRQYYVDKVKHLAEEPMNPFEFPRKVSVYAAKWPGDEDYDQSMRYFRKYVKPILVAAAIDYDMVPGKRHGDIAKRIADDIRVRRRFDLGLEHETELPLPSYKPPAERRRLELEGGIIIIGRPTFKEFMSGLQKGWTEGLEKVDRDEVLADILENDTHFDEPEDHHESIYDNDATSTIASHQVPTQPSSPSPMFSSFQIQPSTPPPQKKGSFPVSNNTNQPPSVIPPLPPLLLVPFTDYIGISQIPLMIWGFFNQRHKVRAGAEAGYRLVMRESQPIEVPENINDLTLSSSSPSTDDVPPTNLGDLDFDKGVESYYRKSLGSLQEDTEKARKKYYENLAPQLNTARQLARGTREPTKAELDNPPPTEVELRAERFKKERRWRDDMEGWDIIKPSSSVRWDERYRSALRIFTTPNDEDDKA